jgi:hypothetical protein
MVCERYDRLYVPQTERRNHVPGVSPRAGERLHRRNILYCRDDSGCVSADR